MNTQHQALTTCFDVLSTEFGELTLCGTQGGALSQIAFDTTQTRVARARLEHDPPRLRRAKQQLAEYFSGERVSFELRLAPIGTPFQLAVWRALGEIPHGETRSYREIAHQLSAPAASRAVGAANGRNPLPIVVPCHRVIGANGTLTGYAGGLPFKRFLLELERGNSGYAGDAGQRHGCQALAATRR